MIAGSQNKTPIITVNATPITPKVTLRCVGPGAFADSYAAGARSEWWGPRHMR